MSKALFLFSFLFLLHTGGFTQAPPGYTPPTPMAAQFEKYISYPVSHNTGAASVSVPLYNLKAGSIDIPISLSYHTSGVKPGDPSIPVGLGWLINPGSRVTRKIMNYPDEMHPKPPPGGSMDPVNDLLLLQNLEYGHPQASSSSRTTVYDAEYDIFTYYTPTGGEGRFIIKQQGNVFIAVPLLITKDKITIVPVPNGGASIDHFEIIDGMGVLYRFGKGMTSYSSQTSSSVVERNLAGFGETGWMLTDIVSANKADTVSFIWKNVKNDNSGNYYKQQSYSDRILLTDRLYSFLPSGPPTPEYTQVGYFETAQFLPSQVVENYSSMTVIAGVRYKSREIIMGYTSNVPTILNSIKVYEEGTQFRQINFHQSTFSTGYKRLDSVSMLDKNNQLIQKYKFGYNETINLPWGLTRSLDFWGYYNGAANSSLIPSFAFEHNASFQPYTTTDRSSNLNASAYILNAVTYPTGGKSTYEYEINQTAHGATGGLRVKKIKHWSQDGNLAETRSFVYGVNESGYGDGILMTADMFNDVSQVGAYWEISKPPPGEYTTDIGVLFRQQILQGTPVNSIFMYDFPPIFYPQVTEYIGEPSGNNSGKIVYNYSHADYPYRSLPYSHAPHTFMDRYWRKPVLESTKMFKKNGGGYSPVRFSYTNYTGADIDTLSSWLVRRYATIKGDNKWVLEITVESDFMLYFAGYLPSVFDYTPTHLYSGVRAVLSERFVDYTSNGDSIVNQTTYAYANNDYLYPVSLTTTNSNGVSTIRKFKYPKDYTVGTSPSNTVAQGIKLLMDRNVVAPVIEEYTEVQPANIIKSGSFTTYKTTSPVPDQVFGLKSITSPGSFTPATITATSHSKSSAYDLKSTISLYDGFGNVRQATDEAAGITTVILYSYNGRFPIAVIKNSTFTNVAAAISGGQTAIDNFAAGYPTNTSVNSFVSTLRSSLPGAFITTYTIDPFLGVTSQTDENNKKTSFEYDAAGRLSLVRDQDNNIVKKYCYNYFGQPEDCSVYTSSNQSGNFYSQNCGSQTPIAYYVNIPAGMFTSTVSAADANAQAQQYGQAQANLYGTCSAPLTTVFASNNTGNTYYLTFWNNSTGQNYSYTVYPWSTPNANIPIGTYTVTVSDSGSGSYAFIDVMGYSTYGTSQYVSNLSISPGYNNIYMTY